MANVVAVEGPKYPATTTLTATPGAGSVTLGATCNMSSVFYFAISLSNSSLANINWETDIKANSLDVGTEASFPTGDNLMIYGYRVFN